MALTISSHLQVHLPEGYAVAVPPHFGMVRGMVYPLGRTGTEVFRLNLHAIWRDPNCLSLTINVKTHAPGRVTICRNLDRYVSEARP